MIALGQNLWQMCEKAQVQFRLKHCGFIFQGYNLFPTLTAREQLEMVLRWGEGAGRDARETGRRDAGTAGPGPARRPAGRPAVRRGEAARGHRPSLIKDPTFCFADEPTSSLDWVHGEQVIKLLRFAAHERGATIFVVAHDPRIIPYADRVCYLEDGCLVPHPSVEIPHLSEEHGRKPTAFTP